MPGCLDPKKYKITAHFTSEQEALEFAQKAANFFDASDFKKTKHFNGTVTRHTAEGQRPNCGVSYAQIIFSDAAVPVTGKYHVQARFVANELGASTVKHTLFDGLKAYVYSRGYRSPTFEKEPDDF